MPEYGRTIQKMIEHAKQLGDKEQRLRCAQTIINIMAGMQPSLREQSDYRRKLWDHLAFMAGYELDIDYPVEITRLDSDMLKPQPLKYPKKSIRNRHYGYVLEQFLGYLATLPEGAERDALLSLTANQMKQSLFDWNRDSMDEDKIATDIERYTEGKVRLDLSSFKFESVVQGNGYVNGGQKKKKKKK